MENGKMSLPLAVTASSGIGGVSPPFSILPEKLVRQTEAFGQAVVQLVTSPVAEKKEAVEAFGSRMEAVANSLDQIHNEAGTCVLSINNAVGEAFRKSFEYGLRLLEDLSAAKGPAEVLNLQLGFLSAQMNLFADHSKIVQCELGKRFSIAAKPGS